MLDSLLIKNFRIFKDISIPKLSRVNLIVGKNNSGKSCLLEAMLVYASRGNVLLLHDLVSARDEHWEQLVSQHEDRTLQPLDSPLRYLFRGYHFPEREADAIEIGPADNRNKRIQIRPQAYQITEDEEGRRLRKPVSQPTLLKELIDVQMALEYKLGKERGILIPLFTDPRDPSYRRAVFPPQRELPYNIITVPTRNLSDSKVASLWDNVNLTDLEEEVLAGLRLVEPKVQGIALVGENTDPRYRNRRRVPIVRCRKSDDRMPLKTMGDGITRLFHIILALVNARDGFLLIDEFENGLHWSIQSQLWEMIFRISSKLNVQVFATTHSRDCISSFHKVWAQQNKNGTFYRLDLDEKDGAKATKYSLSSLADSLDTEVEMR